MPDGLWLALAVQDTGIGIAPENHALIFDSFRQVDGAGDRAFGGTGLGLAITRELTTLQGGAVVLESAPGQGSTFTLLLPVAPEVSSSSILPGRPLVLVVDNDPAALQLMYDYLDGVDVQIIGTTEPAQALDLALRYPPALVITDVMMPHMNGYELVEALRSRRTAARVPVLFLSALQRQPGDPLFAQSEYLLKPVGRDQLLSSVRAAIDLPG
jgi:CheY-like chemotaxis protein